MARKLTKKVEENPFLQSFREFVKQQAAQRNLSLRRLSLEMEMTPSYFSEILNGKKRINVDFLNALADYLKIPRVEVYQAAGWLDLDEGELVANRVREWYSKDAHFRRALDRMMKMDETQRGEIFEWIFYKTLQETGRLQNFLDFDWVEAAKQGDILPDAFANLQPNQRQALQGVVQLLMEAFLVKESRGEGDKFLEDAEKFT